MKRIYLTLLALALSTLLSAQSRRAPETPPQRPAAPAERWVPETRGHAPREQAPRPDHSVGALRERLRERVLQFRERQAKLRDLLQQRGRQAGGAVGREQQRPAPRGGRPEAGRGPGRNAGPERGQRGPRGERGREESRRHGERTERGRGGEGHERAGHGRSSASGRRHGRRGSGRGAQLEV